MSSREPGIVLSHSSDRVAALFGLVSAAALLKGLSFEPEMTMTETFRVSGSDADRLVQARVIAHAYEMELWHRNDYYYASKHESDGIELHFVPAIPYPPGSAEAA